MRSKKNGFSHCLTTNAVLFIEIEGSAPQLLSKLQKNLDFRTIMFHTDRVKFLPCFPANRFCWQFRGNIFLYAIRFTPNEIYFYVLYEWRDKSCPSGRIGKHLRACTPICALGIWLKNYTLARYQRETETSIA